MRAFRVSALLCVADILALVMSHSTRYEIVECMVDVHLKFPRRWVSSSLRSVFCHDNIRGNLPYLCLLVRSTSCLLSLQQEHESNYHDHEDPLKFESTMHTVRWICTRAFSQRILYYGRKKLSKQKGIRGLLTEDQYD